MAEPSSTTQSQAEQDEPLIVPELSVDRLLDIALRPRAPQRRNRRAKPAAKPAPGDTERAIELLSAHMRDVRVRGDTIRARCVPIGHNNTFAIGEVTERSTCATCGHGRIAVKRAREAAERIIDAPLSLDLATRTYSAFINEERKVALFCYNVPQPTWATHEGFTCVHIGRGTPQKTAEAQIRAQCKGLMRQSQGPHSAQSSRRVLFARGPLPALEDAISAPMLRLECCLARGLD